MPLVEVQVVAVGTLGWAHESKLSAISGIPISSQRRTIRGGHVVRGADGIDAHVLHLADLAAHSSLVDSGTERAKVVVEASALELQLTAVEEEAFTRLQLDGADTEGRGIAVNDLRAVGERDGVLIEVGLVDVPELGSRDVEARAIDAVCTLAGEALRALSDDLTLGREDLSSRCAVGDRRGG